VLSDESPVYVCSKLLDEDHVHHCNKVLAQQILQPVETDRAQFGLSTCVGLDLMGNG
jgi:hypothetical protein